MISEKTVELNLTTELVNYFYFISGIRPYILAPSQPEESTLAFDTAIGYPTTGVPYLIQYKRAEFRATNNEYVYHLNYTKKQDQHLKLYLLENKGWNVFYALPKFHEPIQVVNMRQHLLPETLFLKPSWMIPADGSMIGHHQLKYNIGTGTRTVHSDEGREITESFDFYDFVRLLNSTNHGQDEGLLLRFLKDFNSVFSEGQLTDSKGAINEQSAELDPDIYDGLSILVF